MISEKKIGAYKKKCIRGEKYSEMKMFALFFILINTFFLALSLITGQHDTNKELLLFIGFMILISFLPTLLIYFTAVRNFKRTCLITVISPIFYAAVSEWVWDDKLSFTNTILLFLHPHVGSHPSTIFLFGLYLNQNDFQNDGEVFINLAIEKDPGLKNIGITNKIDEKDAEYLIDSFGNDKKLKCAAFWDIHNWKEKGFE